MEIRAFVENLAEFNAGNISGEWITLPIDEYEWDDILESIGCLWVDFNGERHKTEHIFTDFGCEFDFGFGDYEYASIDELNEIAKKLDNWDSDLLEAAAELWGFEYVIDDDPEDYILRPDIMTCYDLGEYYALEIQCIDFGGNSVLENYFDFEAYGRDISFEADGGFTSYGWIEKW